MTTWENLSHADLACLISGALTLSAIACGGAEATNGPKENPVPSVSTVSPEQVTAGQAGFTLTVKGADFVASSAVRWNESDRLTTYVNGGTLEAVIPAGDVASAGAASVTVLTPPPGGGVSSALSVLVVNPVPFAATLSENAAFAGAAALHVTVTGTHFTPTSVVRWNESDLPTTYVGARTLHATIPADDMAVVGTAAITVFNPPPGGGGSDSLAFWVLPRPVGRIAFDSWRRKDDGEVYVMNADGTGQLNLSNSPAWDIFPVWSPDGSKLAFRSTRDGNFQGYVMNADGTGVVNLTNSTSSDGRPVWSPDGSKLAFTSNRDGNSEIYVVNVDGTGLMNRTNSAAHDSDPAWSPDGSKLAFTSDRDGNNEIYLMNADGTGVINLTNSASNDGDPVWSPDGSNLAFECGGVPTVDICLMDEDGTNRVTLVTSASNDFDPVWSPDGSKLAFISTRDGNGEIYLVNADGTGLMNATSSSGQEYRPAWSPDGAWIAYEFGQGEEEDIYLMTADGAVHLPLTVTHAERAPQWKPER